MQWINLKDREPSSDLKSVLVRQIDVKGNIRECHYTNFINDKINTMGFYKIVSTYEWLDESDDVTFKGKLPNYLRKELLEIYTNFTLNNDGEIICRFKGSNPIDSNLFLTLAECFSYVKHKHSETVLKEWQNNIKSLLNIKDPIPNYLT